MSFRACLFLCFDANNLCISKEKVVALERVRSARYRVMAILLDFEEKSKCSFKAKYKHGLSC